MSPVGEQVLDEDDDGDENFNLEDIDKEGQRNQFYAENLSKKFATGQGLSQNFFTNKSDNKPLVKPLHKGQFDPSQVQQFSYIDPR